MDKNVAATRALSTHSRRRTPKTPLDLATRTLRLAQGYERLAREAISLYREADLEPSAELRAVMRREINDLVFGDNCGADRLRSMHLLALLARTLKERHRGGADIIDFAEAAARFRRSVR